MTNPSQDDSQPDFSFLNGAAAQPDIPEQLDFQDPATTENAAPDPEIAPEKALPKRASKAVRKTTDAKPEVDSQPADKDGKARRSTPKAGHSKKKARSSKPDTASEKPVETSDATFTDDMVPRSRFNALLGYAGALTLLFLYLLASGRLVGTHSLESLPDIKPLEPGQFQSVPNDAALPRNHELRLGDSRRFGDVVITPEKVVMAPLEFTQMINGEPAPEMKTRPVMQLVFRLENISSDTEFSPFDVELMCHRNPEGGDGVDGSVLANSALFLTDNNKNKVVRVLNFLHSAESSFDIVGQNSNEKIAPGKSVSSLVASSDVISEYRDAAEYRWRVQIRKGINRTSQQGVTTLIDVVFSREDVEEPKA